MKKQVKVGLTEEELERTSRVVATELSKDLSARKEVLQKKQAPRRSSERQASLARRVGEETHGYLK